MGATLFIIFMSFCIVGESFAICDFKSNASKALIFSFPGITTTFPAGVFAFTAHNNIPDVHFVIKIRLFSIYNILLILITFFLRKNINVWIYIIKLSFYRIIYIYFQELNHRSEKSMRWILLYSNLIVASLYISVGVFGYISFADSGDVFVCIGGVFVL